MIEKKQNLLLFKITKKGKKSSPERIFLLLLQKKGEPGGQSSQKEITLLSDL